jgi:aminoglycoside 6'-N-acetyltransferase
MRRAAEAEITLAMGSEGLAVPHHRERAASRSLCARRRDRLVGRAAPRRPAGRHLGIDLFIASAEHRGRGAGRAALAVLVEEVFATRLAIACCAVVSIRNEAAARVYERSGCRWLRIWQDPIDGPCWVMLRERPAPPAR